MCVLADTKNQLSSETLRRVEMESQVQTLKENLKLHKNVSEQDILKIQNRQKTPGGGGFRVEGNV